ncbi:putative signal transducing protein [Leeuwenhoekiella sp. H156]|uniref:putative signal transducing protein n=1 Tax=Leeuwenhoekiella sp. H156 TaxID=3450128 RepID=UPI003FA4BD73
MKSELKVIAQFTYSTEAQIIKGRLEADGIEAFLQDEYTIDTDPLISNAIGGVKLAVWTEDVMRAKTILESVAEYSVDDEGKALHCPECNSTQVKYYTTVNSFKAFASFLVTLLFSVLPFYTKHEYRCENCKNQFNLNG